MNVLQAPNVWFVLRLITKGAGHFAQSSHMLPGEMLL
jgi:hypothetical protein